MKNGEDIVLRIKQLMDDMSLNQTEFAKECEIEQANLSAILRGKRNIGSSVINKIVLAFGLNPEWLREGTGERFNPGRIKDPHTSYGQRAMNETNIYESVLILSQNNKNLLDMYRQAIEDKRVLEGKLCDLVDKITSK